MTSNTTLHWLQINELEEEGLRRTTYQQDEKVRQLDEIVHPGATMVQVSLCPRHR